MTHISITFATISKILDTLEGMVSAGFGPNALSSLLCTSTGKIMITSNGIGVLQALNIAHPIGQMIIKCITQHHLMTGDNSKTFLFMLAGATRWLEKEEGVLSNNQMRPVILKGLKIIKQVFIPSILMPGLLERAVMINLCDQNRENILLLVEHLVSTSVQGMFDMGTRKHLSKLLCNYVFHKVKDTKVEQVHAVVLDAIDNFEMICLESSGACFSSSKVIDGFVIQRNFLETAPWKKSKKERVRFALVSFPLEGLAIEQHMVVHINIEQDLLENCNSVERKIYSHLKILSSKGVNLIVSRFKINDVTAYICKEHGIAVLQLVDEMEILRLSNLCGLAVVHEPSDLHLPNIVGIAEDCRVISIGRQPRIYLQNLFCKIIGDSVGKPTLCAKQMIVYGSSPGLCKQYSVQILNSLKVLRNWLEYSVENNDNLKLVCSQKSQIQSPCLRVGSQQYAVNATETRGMQKSVYIEKSQKNSESLKSCWTIPGGGAFELYICHLLDRFQKDSDEQSVQLTIQMLRSAYLTVPLKLLSNSYQPRSEKVKIADLYRWLEKKPTDFQGVNAKFGNGLLTDSTVVHPLHSKVLLMYHFIECLEQLVRTDSIVCVTRLNDN